MQEFQKTSKWFKPMSKMMGNRFQEAKGSGSDASEAGGAATAAVDLSYDERKATAVKMKLFGHMTHDEVEWHPHRLLCKRLGIIDPYPKSGVVGTVAPSGSSRGSSARWSELGFADSPLHPVELAPKGAASAASGLAPGKPQSEAAQATARLFASLGEEPAEAAAPEPLPDRPSMDIFKAIFSDSSSEEEEEEGRKEGKNEKNADRMPPVSEKSPVPRRASPVPAGGPLSSTKAPSAIATGVVPAAQQAFAGRFAAVMSPEASPKTTDRQAAPLVVGHTASGRAPDAARGEGAGALPIAKPAAVPVPRSAATAKAADKLELVYNHPLATNGGRRVSPEAEESDGVEDLWVEISRHNKQKVGAFAGHFVRVRWQSFAPARTPLLALVWDSDGASTNPRRTRLTPTAAGCSSRDACRRTVAAATRSGGGSGRRRRRRNIRRAPASEPRPLPPPAGGFPATTSWWRACSKSEASSAWHPTAQAAGLVVPATRLLRAGRSAAAVRACGVSHSRRADRLPGAVAPADELQRITCRLAPSTCTAQGATVSTSPVTGGQG